MWFLWYLHLCCMVQGIMLILPNLILPTSKWQPQKKNKWSCQVDDIRTFLITNYKTMISPRIILQLILLKYLRQYHDRDETINQSILKILLIIDYKSVISIMLIIPKGILFKHATVNNVHYGSDRKPFWSSNGRGSCINWLNWHNYFRWF